MNRQTIHDRLEFAVRMLRSDELRQATKFGPVVNDDIPDKRRCSALLAVEGTLRLVQTARQEVGRMSKSIADRLFDAQTEQMVAEDMAHSAILRALDMDPNKTETWNHEDFTYDYYDWSYELTGANPEWTPTPDQIRATFALGFSQCWINYTDGTEAHYSDRDDRPDEAWGQRRQKAVIAGPHGKPTENGE
jgi:hypothetical protein